MNEIHNIVNKLYFSLKKWMRGVQLKKLAEGGKFFLITAETINLTQKETEFRINKYTCTVNG